MECDSNYITVTWQIENYNFLDQKKCFSSSSFVIDSIKDTTWEFCFFPKSSLKKEHANFFVHIKSGSKLNFGLDFEITFFAEDNHSPLCIGHANIDPGKSYSSKLHVPYHEIYAKRKDIFVLPETLTFRCKIYNTSNEKFFTTVGQCFIRTRIRVEKSAFIGLAEKFSNLSSDEEKNLLIKSFSIENELFTSSLCLFGDLCCEERVLIKIIPIKKDYIKFCKCKLFILDSEGIKTECGTSEILFDGAETEEWKFPLNFTIGSLMKKSSQFLSNDTLSLKLEFAFSTVIEYERIEDSEFGNLSIANKNQPHKFTSALEDMTYLYKEGILCDMKLRIKTETFNVHKIILSARSPVFRTMFTTDMREKTSDCVVIEDLEADTVRRMLVFLYSDKLEDMDWENAKNLYFAADKYNIAALKYKCSEFLMQNLQPSKSCDILLLSDRHQDEELKKAVQEYIAEHHDEILQSDQWMNLGKNNPILTTETFQSLYLRNWKK